jgi:hypothetical protein
MGLIRALVLALVVCAGPASGAAAARTATHNATRTGTRNAAQTATRNTAQTDTRSTAQTSTRNATQTGTRSTAQTDTSSATQTATLRVSLDPDVAGQRTTIELSLHIAGPGGAPPAPLSSFNFRLPAGMGIATTTLGQANCEPPRLLGAGLDGCSANARIGFGNATAVVPVGSQNVRERASLNALMGPAVEDRLEVLFYVEALEPVSARLVLPGVIQEDVRPYGEQLETSVPLIQTWPEGPDLALETFSSTIGPLHLTYFREIGGRTVPYYPRGIRIPKACPSGGYPFAALLNFQDGTHTNASFRVPCPAAQ